MGSSRSFRKNSTVTIQVACAIVFLLFSLAWLYWLQADAIAVTHYVVSGGVNHYNRIVGTLVFTATFFILQWFIRKIVNLRRHGYALTFLPSMVLMAMISGASPDVSLQQQFIGWLYWVPLILIVWVAVIWLVKMITPFEDNEKGRSGIFSILCWENILLLFLMMIGVVAKSNTNAVFLYRAHVENSILHEQYDEALRTGKLSKESDPSLTMLRAYVLSKKGLLGERLFEYAVEGRGADLVPLFDSQSKCYLLPKDSLYSHFGARPVAIHSLKRYFDLLEKDSLATKLVADYRLCGLLVDKKLDEFAHQILKYYPDGNYPKHYREALVLYVHKRSNPVVQFSDPVIDEDWKNLQELVRNYPDRAERKGKVAKRYASSYWYYYLYKPL